MKTCKYPNCFSCEYEDCIMNDNDLELMLEYQSKKSEKEVKETKTKKRTPVCDRCKKCMLVQKPTCEKTTRLCTRKLKLIADSVETTPYWCPRKQEVKQKNDEKH